MRWFESKRGAKWSRHDAGQSGVTSVRKVAAQLLLAGWKELSHAAVLSAWNFEDPEGCEMSSCDSSDTEQFMQLQMEQNSGKSDNEDLGADPSENDIEKIIEDREPKYDSRVCQTFELVISNLQRVFKNYFS
jgi:hypothetical protein